MRFSPFTFALVLSLFTAFAAAAQDKAVKTTTKPKKLAPAELTAADIRACASKNLVNRGALRDLSIQATDREGKSRALKLRLFWKPTKAGAPRMNLRLLEPAAMLGSSYLLLFTASGEEVHFYLPGADRALRVTGQNMAEPLWGTDFSYAEVKQVHGLLAEGATERKADAQVGGRAAYVLETLSQPEETGYQKVLSYIDQAGCVLLKSEFFAKPGKPRKVLEADLSTLLQADTYWLVLGYTMRDLKQKTQTQLSLTDFSLLERLPERLFEPARFFEEFQ